MNPHPHLSRALMLSGAVLLAACGGGGDSGNSDAPAPTPAPAPAPQPVTWSGQVVLDGPIRNTVVCLDLNGNSLCDTGEPASAKTGADGTYSLSFTPDGATATASLIAAQVPGSVTDAATTIDAANPAQANTTQRYVLRQVPGKDGQINPLTTLVASGMAAGMSEAKARENAAIQLGITAGNIDDYQGEPASSDQTPRDNARWAAKLVAATLEHGDPLDLRDQSAPLSEAAGDLASLTYTDDANWFYRQLVQIATTASPGRVRDVRAGETAGSATPNAQLYANAYLTPTGWIRCDASVPIAVTVGNPSRSVYCGTLAQGGFVKTTSIAGQSMQSVIQNLQSDTSSNVINNGVPTANLLSKLATATFPSGSSIRRRTNFGVTQPIYVNNLNTDGRPQSEATTLEQLIAAKPDSAVTLSNGGGTLNLGGGDTSAKNVRVAFTGTTSATTGTVRYFDCDLNASLAIVGCTRTTSGTYRIETVSGVRVLRFENQPDVPSRNHLRVYAEVKAAQSVPGLVTGDWIYMARENKAPLPHAFSTANRLSATAWQAMRTQLGI